MVRLFGPERSILAGHQSNNMSSMDHSPSSESTVRESISNALATATVSIHSKHEEKMLEKRKKRLFDSYSEEVTMLFESLNNQYMKRELNPDSLRVIESFHALVVGAI